MTNEEQATQESAEVDAITLTDDMLITVCAECLRACCWQGEVMCDNARDADILDRTVASLRKLNAQPYFDGEHEDYWKKDVWVKRG